MARNDSEYFARRAHQERERARLCDDSSARRVHQEMAERYTAKLTTRDPAVVLGDFA
ncbi:hypothetical protein S2M10_37180 [Sphingomonas sp. S2M10]|uniref:hypothetical protein n=1 Tax=Sphingomonas sp. S2M10 TaxID=2705010 RepID=UPI001457469B|nr:hypothetical protein [Sphingomonas sp. S2M10]NLS28707.1 hypothetical protein [Sphingomonas sp. S2M10]